MSTQVLDLRKLLEERWPDAQPLRHATAAGLPTGVASLDAILPGGGLPRGRLSVWAPGTEGAPAAPGATAVLRSACLAAVERGERAAWVDGAGVVHGDGWTTAGAGVGPAPVLLRLPPTAGQLEALVCAEELVRCGGFGLVVVTGVGRALAAEAVRLSRAAREGGAALMAVLGSASFGRGTLAGWGTAPVAGLRLSSRLLPDGIRWRKGPFGEPAEPAAVRVRIQATSLGLESRVEVMIPVVQHAFRLSMEPGLVDRRGADR